MTSSYEQEARNRDVRILVLERTPQGGYYSFTLYGARLLTKPKSGIVMRTCLGGDLCIQQDFSFVRLLGGVVFVEDDAYLRASLRTPGNVWLAAASLSCPVRKL